MNRVCIDDSRDRIEQMAPGSPGWAMLSLMLRFPGSGARIQEVLDEWLRSDRRIGTLHPAIPETRAAVASAGITMNSEAWRNIQV